jgi:hypothetical protein
VGPPLLAAMPHSCGINRAQPGRGLKLSTTHPAAYGGMKPQECGFAGRSACPTLQPLRAIDFSQRPVERTQRQVSGLAREFQYQTV